MILLLSLVAFRLGANPFPQADWVEVQKPKDGIQTGTVSGKIFEPDLSASSGAKVEIILGSNNKITGQTDGKGFYMVTGIPAGTGYAVSATKGDLVIRKDRVNVAAGKNTKLDLVLAEKGGGGGGKGGKGKGKSGDSLGPEDGGKGEGKGKGKNKDRGDNTETDFNAQKDTDKDQGKGKSKDKNNGNISDLNQILDPGADKDKNKDKNKGKGKNKDKKKDKGK